MKLTGLFLGLLGALLLALLFQLLPLLGGASGTVLIVLPATTQATGKDADDTRHAGRMRTATGQADSKSIESTPGVTSTARQGEETAPATSRWQSIGWRALGSGAGLFREQEDTTSSQPVAAVRWADDIARSQTERLLAAAQAALAADPDNVAALREAIAVYESLERWDDARAILARLVALLPDDVDVRFAYSATLMRLKLWPQAILELRAVVASQPEHAAAWFNLAVAQQAMRHLSDACETWGRVLQIMPESADARAQRGEALLDLREWAAATADFEAALRLAPDDVTVRMNLALAVFQLGQVDAARGHLLAVLESQPRHVPAMNRLAELAWTMHRADPAGHAAQRAEAADWCRRSLAIDADQPLIQALLDRAEGK